MALPSSCRLFVAQGLCMRRMLSQGPRTVCIPGLFDCKTHKLHEQLSVISPLREFRRRRSFNLHINAPYVNEEGGREHTGFLFTVWSAVGKCSMSISRCNKQSLTIWYFLFLPATCGFSVQSVDWMKSNLLYFLSVWRQIWSFELLIKKYPQSESLKSYHWLRPKPH